VWNWLSGQRRRSNDACAGKSSGGCLGITQQGKTNGLEQGEIEMSQTWMIPVAIVVLLTLAVLDLAIGNSNTTEFAAQALGPYVLG
jgi:hypothetical protein